MNSPKDYNARKIYGSDEHLKGNNYEDPDSFWDATMNSNHVRSKSQPRSAPGSDSLQRKQQPVKQVPRRHTLGGSAFLPPEQIPMNGNGVPDDSRKREAFMDMLAKRYPKYADKISGTSSEDGFPVRPHARRPRDHHRRATVVTYNPSNARDYEDYETMSNVEGPVSFQRGGFLRNSMPIVRTPPNIYDKALGLVFLVYQDETKKSDLPNEITHLDTVRALFVRSFPEKLTLDYLSSPKRKIYILEPKTSIFYQLEDLRDIKDRTVLKLVESESDNPQKVKEPPPEKRGKRTDMRDQTPGYYETPATAVTDQVRKAQTLPASMSHSYPVYRDPIYASDYDIYRTPTPDMTRSGPSRHQSYAHNALYDSPDHVRGDRSTPDRHNLGPIPENLQMQNGYASAGQAYQDHDGRSRPVYRQAVPHRGQGSGQEQLYRSMSPPVQRSQNLPGDPLRRALSPPPTSGMQIYEYLHGSAGPGAPPQTYVAKGVRANTIVSPLRASGPPPDTRHHLNRHSLAFTPMSQTSPPTRPADQAVQRSQSYRITPDRDHPPIVPPPPRSITPSPTTADPETRVRMDKMEEQLANLAAWVQTAVVSGSSRESSIRSGASTTPSDLGDSKPPSIVGRSKVTFCISDISSQTSQHTIITQSIKDGILNVAKQTSDLKLDLRNLRRIQQLNNESMTDSIQETIKKISKVLMTVPGAEHQVLRQQRSDIDTQCKHYKDDGSKVLKELGDLESSVEEMREDVISRQCRVNLADVEGMALVLSHVTKHLGELRCRFPGLQEQMKKVMSGEMEVVIKEERFLKDEPDRIEEALKRCKRLTGTLFTLKRLASAQEQRPLQVPTGKVGGRIPTQHDRKDLMENIKAVVPDHDSRVQSIQAADASRERKRKIITQQEALKFGKSLEKATKALKSAAEKEQATKQKPKSETLCTTKGHCDGQDTVTKGNQVSSAGKPLSTSESQFTTKFSVPLTSTTTEKIVLSSSSKGSEAQRKQIDEKIIRTSSDAKKPPLTLSSSDEENVKRSAAKLAVQKNAARAAFFSSLTTPPTSPSEEKRVVSPEPRVSPARTTMDYTVRISPCRSSVSGTTKYIVKDSSNVPKSSSSATRPTAKVSFSSPTSSSSDSSPSPNSPITSSSRTSNIPRFSATKPETESQEKYTFQKEATIQKPSILKNSQTGTSHDKSGELTQSNITVVPKSESENNEGTADKPDLRPKKVPPPPPPRKSSKLMRSAPVSGYTSPHCADDGTSVSGFSSPHRADESKSSDIQDSSIVAGNNDGTVKFAATCTSTPKPAVPQKPSRIMRERILSEQSRQEGNIDKCENLNSSADSTKSFEGVKLKLSEELAREDREGSIDSSTSSSSGESQQSVVEKDKQRPEATTSVNGGPSVKKPKPPPPVRKSSLAEDKLDTNDKNDVNES